MRRRLQGSNAVLDFPLFEELAARGLTEWYGAVNGFEANSAV